MDWNDSYYSNEGDNKNTKSISIKELLEKYQGNNMKSGDQKNRFDTLISMEYSNIKSISVSVSSRHGMYNSLINNLANIDTNKERINPVGCILGYFCIDPVSRNVDMKLFEKIYNELKHEYSALTREYMLKYVRYWMVKLKTI